MAEKTLIEWTDATWNPITGCRIASWGCRNCYAMTLAATRLQHHPSRAGLTEISKAGPVWTGEVRLNEQWLSQPLRWRRPRRIFVCAHGDLFYEAVPDEWIDRVFAIMALCPQHIFQVLTKRPARMRKYLQGLGVSADRDRRNNLVALWQKRLLDAVPAGKLPLSRADAGRHLGCVAKMDGDPLTPSWPLPNVWLGVSAEDQKQADQRIPDLLTTPAAIRFASAEPLLSHINFRRIRIAPNHHTMIDALDGYRLDGNSIAGSGQEITKLDWVIVGGESGPGARPMHPDWARSLRNQCADTDVPFFFKQWGEWSEASNLPSELQENYELEDKLAYFPSLSGEPVTMARLGKRAAGHLLDGIEHRAFPVSPNA